MPSGDEVESFFVHELCETSQYNYFLAVSDLFAEVVSKQPTKERCFSLGILYGRLLDAADFAETADTDLPAHFGTALKRFGELYFETAQLTEVEVATKDDLDFIRLGCLAVNAILLADLHPECSNENEIRCQECGHDITVYSHARWWRN